MVQSYHLIKGAVASNTGVGFKVGGATSVSIIAKRADHSSGSSVVSVTVSPDNTNYVTYNKLIDNVANTSSEQLTRVASKTLSSNSTIMLTLDPDDAIKYIKVAMTRVTDGTNDLWLVVNHGEGASI